jgi:signal transduction histidine kinase
VIRGLARDTRALVALVPAGLAAFALTCAAALTLLLPGGVRAAVRRRASRRRRLLAGNVADPLPSARTLRREVVWQAGLGLVVLPLTVMVILLWIAALAAVCAPLLAALPFEGVVVNGRSIDSRQTAWLVCAQGLIGCVLAVGAQRVLRLAEERLSRLLLRPSRADLLAGRVEELAGSRAERVDAAAKELRRIERDLHDGAQAQLTALTIQLGLAEQLLDGDARRLVADARAGAGAALQSLRDVVHGIHPPLLAERGLAGAVQELSLGLALAVSVRGDLPARPPEPVESALYFTAAELLTNAGRHAHATTAAVEVRRDGDTIRLTVSDNGRGGARLRPGGGLDGLRRRLAAFDGTLVVSSPPGGPTVVEVSVPCEW